MITVNTKLLALLGKPLAQSISYKLHNRTYERLGLDFYYMPLEVDNEHLGEVVGAIRWLNFAGLAITKPCKIEVMQYLDDIDDLAKKMGAVNTVVKEDGRLKGYNTDGEGCVASLIKHYSGDLRDATVMCLGAGGSARAVCCTLAHKGVKALYVATRRNEKAKELVDEINTQFAPIAFTVDWHNIEAMHGASTQSTIIMNHTGVGMAQYTGMSPVPKDIFHPGQLVFDAIYSPAKSQFLMDAEACGATVLNGLEMVLNQGVIQAELWTGSDKVCQVMAEEIHAII